MDNQLFPLTGPQKNIWQLEQVNMSNKNLNMIYSALKLPKNTNIELLDKTLNTLIEINDSIRIRFYFDENSNIHQYIEKYSYTPIRIITHHSESISEVIENEKNNFLSIENPVEICIVKTPYNVFVLYKTHHILSDGWGLTQVADQIKEIYCLYEKGENLSTYKKPSYLNFINREQEYLKSSRYNKDEAFWKDYVKNIEPCTIFKKRNDLDKSAERYEKEIPSNICKKIEAYCTANKINEYSFFLTVVSIYFYHIYGLNNFAIGTPFLNRHKHNQELEDTGLHVSTLPLSVEIPENCSFLELCNNLNSKNLSIYKHGSFPYFNIHKLFTEEKNINTNLYEIGFSYQINISEKVFDSVTYDKNDTSSYNQGIGDCAWFFSGMQNNCITFHFTQLNKNKFFAIDYLTSVFNKNNIENIHSTIFYIIKQVLDFENSELNNSILIENIQVLSPSELLKLQKFNNTGKIKNINKNVVDYFENIAKTFPNKTALICDNNKLTYSQFNNLVNCLANNLLSELKNKKSNTATPIVLLLDKSFDMFISLMAVLKTGNYYVPILPDENEDRIKYIIKDCNPSLIITHKNYGNLLKKLKVHYCNFEELINIVSNCNKPQNKISKNSLAYMIYTSGSTGNPKGVQVMHKNIIGFIESMKANKEIKPSSSDVSMSLLKYSFDASGIDIYSSLLLGGTLVIVSKNDELNPVKVLELIEKHKITRSFLIPKWIENITITSLNYNYDLSSLKLLGTGGEILKPNLLKKFLEKYTKLKILNLYGPTETTMFTTYKLISSEEINSNYTSIGKPIPYSRALIINSKNIVLPTNCEGELVIYEDNNSIKNISKGYLNLPEKTKERFINLFNPITNSQVRAYKTGDIAKINDNMEIDFIGRTDDIVKINGGYLVAINEVEKRINELLTNNIESYCVAVPYKNTKALVLFIKKSEKSIFINNIKNYLKENLSFYMQPKKIIELQEIPRNNSEKVHRQVLKDLATIELNKQNNNILKPRTPLETEIYNVIKNLINIDDFSITDDFVDDLGIDSLTLTSIYVALNNYKIAIQDLYTNSNIQELALFIENKNKSICLEPEIKNIKNINILNNCKSFDLSSVLITGVTGFLGIHLLHDLLLNKKVKKIYCIIRNKIGIDGSERLKSMIDYYYNSDEKLFNLINEKIIVLNGDISRPNFNLDIDTYNLLKKDVKTVINSAANVKHFAKPSQLKQDNVTSVDNIIDFCQDNISLAHISTLSIAGFKGKSTENKIFDENTIYIKQNFNNNPYLISKFNAEIHILEAIQNRNLNAKIFRLGNIMPRQKDGKFQSNFSQNIFITAIKNILQMQLIADEMLNLKIEFSPVDECAKSIISLLPCGGNTIYHILNNNEIKIEELISILNKNGYCFTTTTINKFIENLNNYSDEYVKEYITSTNLNKYSQNISLNILNKNNFKWSISDEKYLKRIIDLINSNL